MQNHRNLLLSAFLLAATTTLAALPSTASPANAATTLNTTQTASWEEQMLDAIRRIRSVTRPTSPPSTGPVKSQALALSNDFILGGIPEGLSAAELDQIETDSAILRDCADLEQKPPYGTDYGLVVFIHALGKDIHAAAVGY